MTPYIWSRESGVLRRKNKWTTTKNEIIIIIIIVVKSLRSLVFHYYIGLWNFNGKLLKRRQLPRFWIHRCTGCLQMTGAVSKVKRNLFLISHGHKVHRQQRQLSKFLMRYQQFARSCLLRGQFPRWRRSRKRLSVCSVSRCPDLWLQRSVHETHAAL